MESASKLEDKAVTTLIRLIEMFDEAAKAIKYPKIRNLHIDGYVITMYRTGEKSKYPGSISVNTAENIWLGNITREGRFWQANGCPSWVREVLQKLADNPEAITTAHGKVTGNCCFCGRLLTDDRDGYSVELGRGPICSRRYNLEWGVPKAKKPTKKAYKEWQNTEGNPLALTFDAWASIQVMGF
jgi:hypothetical protein